MYAIRDHYQRKVQRGAAAEGRLFFGFGRRLLSFYWL